MIRIGVTCFVPVWNMAWSRIRHLSTRQPNSVYRFLPTANTTIQGMSSLRWDVVGLVNRRDQGMFAVGGLHCDPPKPNIFWLRPYTGLTASQCRLDVVPPSRACLACDGRQWGWLMCGLERSLKLVGCIVCPTKAIHFFKVTRTLAPLHPNAG